MKKSPARATNVDARREAVHHAAETDDEPYIGVQLRHYRTLRRLKLRELAELADCSESLLSRIENNRLNPSFSTLRKLCKALDVNVGQLLSIREETLCTTYAEGARPVIGRTRLRTDLRKVAAEVFIPYAEGRLLEGFVMVFEPGGGSNGKVSHRGEEAGYVVEGQLKLVVDRETYLLETGATFFFRSDIPHEYSNPGTTVTRVVWINTPPSI
ncbi:cupin domain-containing protein [Burkholderia sp. WAC0059]|uniref:cupin domain-containing protein n=1 Tax=Burkholderia sp. WAC0059 TaxID=2066022 RepID=UPI0015E12E66|nr:cupin domain-containing protein [Burkholderia sp. WAC0059]